MLLIDRQGLAGYRRRALLAYPREYGEVLYGTVSNTRFSVKRFIQVPSLSSPTHWWVDWDKLPRRDGRLSLLGVIHSHPDWESCEPSEDDWEQARQRPEIIVGICTVNPIYSPKTRVKFYRGLETMFNFRLV